MIFSLKYYHDLFSKIRQVNDRGTASERIDEMIVLRQQVQERINDELDEIFALVNTKEEQAREISKRSVKKILESFEVNEPAMQLELNYERLLERCNEEISKLGWYDRELLLLYTKLGSYRKVSKDTKIPTSSIVEAVRRARADIKKGLKHDDL